jgi:hypothetical protein
LTLLDSLTDQTQMPHEVVLSVESEEDLPELGAYPFDVRCIFGPRGSCVQRNRILRTLGPNVDVVVIYDDDFVPSRFSVAGLARFFREHPDVAGADGLVLADGVVGPGLSPEAAVQIVAENDSLGESETDRIIEERAGLYGCNMAYRVSSIEGIEFDESLPLYAWLEDIDFGGRVPGRLVRTDAFRGVHCGEKRGREKSGVRLGYSQVSNPVHMAQKGSISVRTSVAEMVRTLGANHLKALRPEPWIDRRGRVVGNWLAIADVVRGCNDPGRIRRL